MELGRELDLGLNELVRLSEGHVSQRHAQSELAALVYLVLVLHVRVHIAKEKLFIVLVG